MPESGGGSAAAADLEAESVGAAADADAPMAFARLGGRRSASGASDSGTNLSHSSTVDVVNTVGSSALETPGASAMALMGEERAETGTQSLETPFAARSAAATAVRSSAKAKAPVVVRLEALISVPPLEKLVFDTWEDFHTYLLEYGQQTSQLYSVRSATPSSRRNSLLSKKKSPQTQKLIPEQFVHYVKTITCTHGGKPRPRSTGLRPNHQHRAIECPAQINACVKKDGQGIWKVHVTNQHAWHNHDINEAIYNGYPEVRNALGADVLATVNILRKAEAKRKKILEYIVENTPHKPKMKDVHNLLSKMKKKDQKLAV
uniref:FAR1 domain-containing protein n=1 Tax=Globisporangium ultimum (strain ATCC 200006 / CBS 805.95 / DAOM BR144) TaxID=431595 RepID=K3WY95_GLOUD